MLLPESYPGLRGWIATAKVQALASAQPHPHEHVSKSGIVPFYRDGAVRRYLVMRPLAQHPELGLPALQLCKGTRYCYRDNGRGVMVAEDMTILYKTYDFEGALLESPLEAALREGREEIGLRHENILALFDAGITQFTSARTGKPKPMYLYAAYISDPDAFDAPDTKEAATEETRWVTVQEFAQAGREDHQPMLATLDVQLGEAG